MTNVSDSKSRMRTSHNERIKDGVERGAVREGSIVRAAVGERSNEKEGQ
jgi:hypothetical protein